MAREPVASTGRASPGLAMVDGAGVNLPVDTSRNPTWYRLAVLGSYGPNPHTGSWHALKDTWGRLTPGRVSNRFAQTRPATTAIVRRPAIAGASDHRGAPADRRVRG